jgi:dihydroxyacetone kinase-like protein
MTDEELGTAVTLDVARARAWVETFAARFESSRVELTALDRLAGDGDFGTNLQVPLERACAALAAAEHLSSVSEVFEPLSAAFMRAGGTSGPLFGVFFRELGRAESGDSGVGLAALASAVASGTAVVQRLGGAEVGDSTMVDAMAPAAQALTDAAGSGIGLAEGLAAAAVAARAGAASTAELVARRGRASYVGEVGRGVLDPGNVAVALFFEAAPGVAMTADSV